MHKRQRDANSVAIMEKNVMAVEELTDDLVAVLRIVKESGPAVCTGSCKNRRPGELHCFNASQMLNISAAGFTARLQKLALIGLLDRQRVTRDDGKVMGQYTLSEKGSEAIMG
jgi:hypothetical protein